MSQSRVPPVLATRNRRPRHRTAIPDLWDDIDRGNFSAGKSGFGDPIELRGHQVRDVANSVSEHGQVSSCIEESAVGAGWDAGMGAGVVLVRLEQGGELGSVRDAHAAVYGLAVVVGGVF